MAEPWRLIVRTTNDPTLLLQDYGNPGMTFATEGEARDEAYRLLSGAEPMPLDERLCAVYWRRGGMGKEAEIRVMYADQLA